MNAFAPDARGHLTGLVNQTITTFRGEPNRIVAVLDDTVLVATGKSLDGEAVPLAWVQEGIDLLVSHGEVRVGVESLGYRSAFVAAVLLTLPGAERATDPNRVVLRRDGWTLRPGEFIRRVDLHNRYGGSRQNGISPSRTTPNIFVFSDPAVGEQHGYLDHWEDGVFHYAGEGQRGDQTLNRGNGALLAHDTDGRTLRVFWGAGGEVEYAGEFTLDRETPIYWTKAQPTGGGPLRQVVMFRLQPVAAAIGVPATARRREAVTSTPRFSTPSRAADETTTTAPRDPFTVDPDTVDRGLRSHAATQNALSESVRANDLVPLSPGPADPDFDLAWRDGQALVVAEIKSITAGNEIRQLRLGLGQLLDYLDVAKRATSDTRGVLAVEAEPADKRWIKLCEDHGVTLVWPSIFESLFSGSNDGSLPTFEM